MNEKGKAWIATILGIIILIADIIWTYQSYHVPIWLALGIIILIADIAWILLDLFA
ncbi:MAG: hypothetical protein QXL16_02620 [Candidatus Micrarchaeaceae archaeon]